MNTEMIHESLHAWVLSVLGSSEEQELSSFTLLPLNSDAGFRRYFRICHANLGEGSTAATQSLLAVYAPVDTEDTGQFIRVCQWLRGQGVRVPHIIASDIDQGFLVVEDLGDQLLQDRLDASSVDALYSQSLRLLLTMQMAKPDTHIFPVYSAEKLDEEMQLCQTWFFEHMLALSLTPDEQVCFDRSKTMLIDAALVQPQVVVHRDFHSRNVLVLESGVATIDFQDAVIGPWTYDLVSLVKDCYVRWDNKDVERWTLAYAEMAIGVGIVAQTTPDRILRDMHLMGLQRHIKVLGIFARLALRDNKQGYLDDLPRVIDYVCDALTRYAGEVKALAGLRRLFQEKVIPAAMQQAWWPTL